MGLEKSLEAVAITDHDCTTAIDEAIAAAQDQPIRVIPGIELSAEFYDQEVHVLGYFINYHDENLQLILEVFRAARLRRTELIVKKLNKFGILVSIDRVKEIAKGEVIGRPFVAMALIELGYVESITEGFEKYLNNGCPGYVERLLEVTPKDAIRIIRQVGGVPVLAHPKNYKDLIPKLAEIGLVGLEVYYGSYSPELRAELSTIADQYNLIKTGGSDFHSPTNTRYGRFGESNTPASVVKDLERCWQSENK